MQWESLVVTTYSIAEEQLEGFPWDGAFSALSYSFLSLRTSSRKTVKPEPGVPKEPLLTEHSLA